MRSKSKSDDPRIVVIDEIDSLIKEATAKDREALTERLLLNKAARSNFVGVANSPFYFINIDTAKSVVFEPYTVQEVKEVVKLVISRGLHCKRRRELIEEREYQALQAHFTEQSALHYVAAKVSTHSGDMRLAFGTVKRSVELLRAGEAPLTPNGGLLEKLPQNIQRELEKQEFWDEESPLERDEPGKVYLACRLDAYLKKHGLLHSYVKLLSETSFKETQELLKTLPNATLSLLFAMVLAYRRRIVTKRDRTLVYLNLDSLFMFLKRTKSLYIHSFTDICDASQILQDYGFVKERLDSPNPKLAKIRLQIDIDDLERHFASLNFAC